MTALGKTMVAHATPVRMKLSVPEVDTRMRAYFSTYHLWAAEHFAELTAAIEDSHTAHDRFDIKHRTYVTSAILASVAFMEAAINETFQDIVDQYASYVDIPEEERKELIKNFWHEGEDPEKRRPGERESILSKYQAALKLTGKNQFDPGKPPYQGVKLLIALRNELVHYKPKWSGAGAVHNLEKKLQGKFPLNKLVAKSKNPFFPDKCLGSGCATWAIKECKSFTNEFFKRMNFTPNYQRVKF